MKALEQLVVRARTRVREQRARLGLGARPSRLLLRLDGLDAPGAVPSETLGLDGWFDAVVCVVEWSGALPVVLVARADHPHLAELVRFAHRLECPTRLITSCAGMTRVRADELVDAGLDAVHLRVAGVSDAVQGEVLGESVADTRGALEALRAARASRGVALDVVFDLPFGEASSRELRATVDEARTAGVDGLRLVAPWSGGPYGPAALDALAWFESQPGPFNRTATATYAALRAARGDGPGVVRTGGSCPVGGAQIELLPDGSVRACPFKGGAARVGDAMAPSWNELKQHRDAVRACDRACAHPLLVA